MNWSLKKNKMNNFIIERICKLGLQKPDTVAIKDKSGVITYKQLCEAVEEYASQLLKKTGGSREPVIVYQDRNRYFIISMLACLKAGCFYIPVVRETPAERIEQIIKDSKCRLALTDERIDHPGLNQLNVRTKEWVEAANDDRTQEAWWQQPVAYVMYTSGTTGTPKGVIIRLDNLQNLVESFGEILYNGLLGVVNVAVLASFGFDSSVKQIYCSLYYGHTLVIATEHEKHFSKLLQQFYSENEINISDGTPSNLRILLMTKKRIQNQVDFYVIGGENFPVELARKMMEMHENKIRIINVYGPTECCVDVSYNIVDERQLEGDFIPIGVPLLNTRLAIVDECGEEIKESGKKGELVVFGRQVGSGYTNGRNEKFGFGADTFENYYYTGDIASMDECSRLIVHGRRDHQIKRSGYRIELDEIAIQVKKTELVLDVVVRKMVFDEREKVVAFVVVSPDTDVTAITRELQKRLPQYMVPDKLIRLESIPLNLNGKTDEKKLKLLYEESVHANKETFG